MSASDPGGVKTRASGECAESFSIISSLDADCQSCSFLFQRNRDKRSTRKFGVRVFTQPGPIPDISTKNPRRSRALVAGERIIAILREHEAGSKTGDICRKHQISSATFYEWRAKYGGLDVSEACRLKVPTDENVEIRARR
jgi:hypothetical protein